MKVYKPDLSLIASTDGGKSFTDIGGGCHGDFHDLWIDPTNSDHIIAGDDGGVWYSYDGGNKWWKGDNLPISQFYHVSVDMDRPYNVYGGLQDNSSWVGMTRVSRRHLQRSVAELLRRRRLLDVRRHGRRDLHLRRGAGRRDRAHQPQDVREPQHQAAAGLRRSQAPLQLEHADPHEPHAEGRRLPRRAVPLPLARPRPDLGAHLARPDHERSRRSRSRSSRAASRSTTPRPRCTRTIYAIAESPKDPNVIWVGTDDGNLQLTRDGGKTWTNVVANVTGLPKSAWVSFVEAGHFDAGTAYATFDLHTFGDMKPYVYRTADFGKTWTSLAPTDGSMKGYAHVVREDPVEARLLYVGTELGLWISLDGGRQWAQFKGGDFPNVAVRDLVVHPRDATLVLGTHGRGIWIVDDITPLRSLSEEILAREAAFVPAQPAVQRILDHRRLGLGRRGLRGPEPAGAPPRSRTTRRSATSSATSSSRCSARTASSSPRFRRASAAASRAPRGRCASSPRAFLRPRRSPSAPTTVRASCPGPTPSR